jgi:pimeloyl-ACP methyl ester carboxylesterase
MNYTGGVMLKRIVQENGIVADLFHDGSGKPHKAIVLLGGSEGGKAWSSRGTKKMVDKLVSQGYALLSLAYFKSPGLPPLLQEIPLEYFAKAFKWLAHQPEALPDELAVIGMSRGAEAALLLGSRNPKIKAVVALSGSHVVWQGIPKLGAKPESTLKSDWSYHGKGLPFVSYGISSWNIGTIMGTLLYGKLRKIHEQALLNQSHIGAAVIPVEKIQGGVLLTSGKRDKMWPSTEMSEQIMSRLAARGFAYPYKHIAYDAGHNNYILKPACLQEIVGFLQEHYS